MSDKHYVAVVMVILVAQTTNWLKQGTKMESRIQCSPYTVFPCDASQMCN